MCRTGKRERKEEGRIGEKRDGDSLPY